MRHDFGCDRIPTAAIGFWNSRRLVGGDLESTIQSEITNLYNLRRRRYGWHVDGRQDVRWRLRHSIRRRVAASPSWLAASLPGGTCSKCRPNRAASRSLTTVNASSGQAATGSVHPGTSDVSARLGSATRASYSARIPHLSSGRARYWRSTGDISAGKCRPASPRRQPTPCPVPAWAPAERTGSRSRSDECLTVNGQTRSRRTPQRSASGDNSLAHKLL